MLKKIVSILLSLTCLVCLFAFVGCNEKKDTREHVTLLVYDFNDSETYLCELSEENPRHTIRVVYRPEGWDFHVKVKFPNGLIDWGIDGNRVMRSLGIYISPEGEEKRVTEVLRKGTYEFEFEVENGNKFAYPFMGILIIEVI